jgi:tetratricopeptide (TPR) repeat protein
LAKPHGPLAALLIVCLAGTSLGAQPTTGGGFPIPDVRRQLTLRSTSLDRLLRWLEYVEEHEPGRGDAPAFDLAQWSQTDLESVAAELERLSAFLERTSKDVAARSASLRLYDRQFTREELTKIFRGNETLRRGAVLHADIAMFVDIRGRPPATPSATGHVVVQDGRQQGGVQHGSVSWHMGRLLLDALEPDARTDAGARLWYQAVSAHLLREGHLAEARTHLTKARQVFPDDPSLLLDSAYLHQNFASPVIQAAVQEVRAKGANVAVDPPRTELQRAEGYFRQVLALVPEEVDARLRLGHTLGELGQHAAAETELRRAAAASLDAGRDYLTALFLGRVAEALGRRDDAVRQYERAAARFPYAQSPRLALSLLARQAGDRARALRELYEATTLPAADGRRIDPWWDYYDVHVEDADALLERMRALARSDHP